jgi:hypothetical protein
MKQDGKKFFFFLLFLMRIVRRACASIICGQLSKREFVILSSLVSVACMAWIRFSLFLHHSLYSLVFLFWSTATKQQARNVKQFFYFRYNWVSILCSSSSSSSSFFISISSYVVFCCLCLSFSRLVHYYCKRDDALPTMVMMAN